LQQVPYGVLGEVWERIGAVTRLPVQGIVDRQSEAFTVHLVVRIFPQTNHAGILSWLQPGGITEGATSIIDDLLPDRSAPVEPGRFNRRLNRWQLPFDNRVRERIDKIKA
jgi:hypothetical protein